MKNKTLLLVLTWVVSPFNLCSQMNEVALTLLFEAPASLVSRAKKGKIEDASTRMNRINLDFSAIIYTVSESESYVLSSNVSGFNFFLDKEVKTEDEIKSIIATDGDLCEIISYLFARNCMTIIDDEFVKRYERDFADLTKPGMSLIWGHRKAATRDDVNKSAEILKKYISSKKVVTDGNSWKVNFNTTNISGEIINLKASGTLKPFQMLSISFDVVGKRDTIFPTNF